MKHAVYIYIYIQHFDGITEDKRPRWKREDDIQMDRLQHSDCYIDRTLSHQNSVFCRQSIYVFHVIIISVYFITQYQAVGFCNAGTVCSLRGRNFFLKKNTCITTQGWLFQLKLIIIYLHYWGHSDCCFAILSINCSTLNIKIPTPCKSPYVNINIVPWYTGFAVAQLVEALCYKPEDRGFDSRWCHWNFSLT
jgi:hypothetical protein